jgi:uncharacterized protein with HEPN domain
VPTPDPARRLRDIVENIERIRTYVAGMNAAGFAASAVTRDAVERCFGRISESASKLGLYMDDRYPSISWIDVRRLGNVLRHEYDDVDEDLVWGMIETDLAPLRSACLAEIQRLAEDQA